METKVFHFNDNGHDFELTVLESNVISSLRKTPIIEKGFWCYWTVKREGKVTSGLPVQDGNGKILFFKTTDEAVSEAKKFMGF